MTSLQLTYSGVLLAVFANQLCLPIPSIVFLMAAGALSAQGAMRMSITILLGVLGCLAADWIWFSLGRRWGSKALKLLCRFTDDPRRCSRKAQEKFHRYGLPVLCVAKFVPGLDGLLPPLGGAQGVPLAAFLALDGVGSLLWSGCYVGVGYIFSNELDIAIRWAQHFGSALALAIGVPLGLYAGWRALVLVRMIRRLRVRHISPPMLARKLKSGNKVIVLDLLNFEGEPDGESLEAVPGAFSVDPTRLRKSPQINFPNDIKIVLYSASGRDTVAARAALGLKRVGIHNVWVLEGGLKAWRERGLPVSRRLEVPETVAARFGIQLPAQ